MKNKIHISSFILAFYSTIFAFLLLSCEAQKIPPAETSSSSEQPSSRYATQNAVEYDAIYRGTLPCADCEGIKTTIYFKSDNTFKKDITYLGKNSKTITSTGNIVWTKTGNSVMLKSTTEETKYAFSEDALTMLDQSWGKINGNLASKYILTKDNYSVLHRKWRLVEIMGKTVTDEQSNNKGAFLQFLDAENRYSATAGCNTISGSFRTESTNGLQLGSGISTMMACGEMTLENNLKKILETTNSFQLQGNDLTLMKGNVAVAKFVAPVN